MPTLGPLTPATTAEDTSIGTVAWSSIGNAQTSNNAYAFAGGVPGSSVVTRYIKATNFNFALDLPTDAVIDGVFVDVEKKANLNNANSHINDESVRLVIGGVIAGEDRANTGAPWGTSDYFEPYGGSTDLWGLALTAADIRSSSFGVVFSCRMTDSAAMPLQAQVDVIRVSVYYNGGLNLSGRVDIVIGADGTLTGDPALYGQANIQIATAGTLAVDVPLAGTTAIAIGATGTLSVLEIVNLSGTAAIVIGAEGTLNDSLTGIVAIAIGASGTLTVVEYPLYDPENSIAAHLGSGVVQIYIPPPSSDGDFQQVREYEIESSFTLIGPYEKFSNRLIIGPDGFVYNFPLNSTVYLRIRSVSVFGQKGNWVQVKRALLSKIKVRMRCRAVQGSKIPEGAMFCVKKHPDRIMGFISDEEIIF